jgi:hypothetical protein
MSLSSRVADLTAYNQLLESRIKEIEGRYNLAGKVTDDFMKMSAATKSVETNLQEIRVSL